MGGHAAWDIPLIPDLISTLSTKNIHTRINTHTQGVTDRKPDRQTEGKRGGACFHSKPKLKGRGNVCLPFDMTNTYSYTVRHESSSAKHFISCEFNHYTSSNDSTTFL